ncbi:MAG TPA: hypothetical protein VEU30_12730, partial [Thermoanaerobaculia bacterium]|nr:hypothetical protein [Thermoanaerobaculia bacterium]
ATRRDEFSETEANKLRELTGKAIQVIRLSGDYEHPDRRNDGYRQARDVLLQNSDILVAVFDPEAAAREAGTRETVGVALDRGTPVVAVLVHAGEARIRIVHRKEGHDLKDPALGMENAASLAAPEWRGALDGCVESQLVLPELLKPREHEHDETVKHAVERLRMMIGTRDVPWLCRNRTLTAIFRWSWNALLRVASCVAPQELTKHLREERELPADDIELEPYKQFYDQASRISSAFMQTSRGAFVLSYFLAGLAVTAAVTMMAVLIYTHGHPPVAVMLMLCAVKIIILVVLLALERQGHKGRLQEAAADFRYLAEILRPMQWLNPAGIYPPAVELPLHAAPLDPRRSWMAWLAREVARSSRCVTPSTAFATIPITASFAMAALRRAKDEWIAGQVLYHWKNAVRMRVLDEGLERLAKALLWIVLVAAFIACALELSGDHGPVPLLLGTAAAVLPAFIAGLSGIAFQSEAKRLAARSEAMHRALHEQQRQIDAAIEHIERYPHESMSAVATILQRLSAITVEEAGHWKVLYQVHVIHAG